MTFISMFESGADIRSIALAFGVSSSYVAAHLIRYVAKRHSQRCENLYFQACSHLL